MEKLLQPIRQEGFSEGIWKSITAAPDTEKDLLSDGENHVNHSPVARGIKRTADGEEKSDWDESQGPFPQSKVQSPPAAMPPEARAEGTDDENTEFDFKPNM
jgi:hypothetical protein